MNSGFINQSIFPAGSSPVEITWTVFVGEDDDYKLDISIEDFVFQNFDLTDNAVVLVDGVQKDTFDFRGTANLGSLEGGREYKITIQSFEIPNVDETEDVTFELTSSNTTQSLEVPFRSIKFSREPKFYVNSGLAIDNLGNVINTVEGTFTASKVLFDQVANTVISNELGSSKLEIFGRSTGSSVVHNVLLNFATEGKAIVSGDVDGTDFIKEVAIDTAVDTISSLIVLGLQSAGLLSGGAIFFPALIAIGTSQIYSYFEEDIREFADDLFNSHDVETQLISSSGNIIGGAFFEDGVFDKGVDNLDDQREAVRIVLENSGQPINTKNTGISNFPLATDVAEVVVLSEDPDQGNGNTIAQRDRSFRVFPGDFINVIAESLGVTREEILNFHNTGGVGVVPSNRNLLLNDQNDSETVFALRRGNLNDVPQDQFFIQIPNIISLDSETIAFAEDIHLVGFSADQIGLANSDFLNITSFSTDSENLLLGDKLLLVGSSQGEEIEAVNKSYQRDTHDYIFAGDGNDSVQSEGGNDFIFGGSGNDYIASGDGNDWIQGEEDNDELLGGEGTDTAVFSDVFENYDLTISNNIVTVIHSRGTQTDGTDTLIDIEFAQFSDELVFLQSPGQGIISGTKWNDIDANGLRNNNEPGLSGVQIYLDTNNNSILDSNEVFVITDESGNYQFTGLLPDTYIVREVIPESFIQTFPLGIQTTIGDGFADVVLEFFDSGTGELSGAHGGTAPNFNSSSNGIVPISTDVVLGDDNDGVDFLVLPEGSYITVSFTDETIIDQPGNDIFITEFAPKDEIAEVFVSSDSTNFEFLGIADGGTTTALDLAAIGFSQPVQAIRIFALNQGIGTPGFELANVRVLENSIAGSDFHTVDLSAGEVVENIDFGNFNQFNSNPTEIVIPDKPNNAARSKGEPHLTTFDGVGYDFQGAGEFTLVESNNGELNIQVRYAQIDPRATVATAVATEVEGQIVVIDSEGIEFDDNGIPFVTRSTSGGTAKVTIDGVEVDINSGSSIAVGNSRIYRSSGEKYTIVFAGDDGIVNDGDDQVVVDYLRPGTINIVDVFLGDEYQGQLTGLLGNLNSNPDDDIALPNGDVLPRPLPFDRLYGDYADAYRIKNVSESFFNYEAGQNPDTFYNPNFPESSFTYDDLSPEDKERGDAAALAAGYTPGTFEFESAAFDFAITNDSGFLEGVESDPEVVEQVTTIISPVNFIGAEIQFEKLFPSLDSSPRETEIVIVGDGVEFSLASFDSDPTTSGFSGGYSINITETSIIYEAVETPVDNPRYNDADFNGFLFTDISNTLPTITNVTIDSSTTTFDVDISDINFTEDTIAINLEGIAFTPGEIVKLDVTFDDAYEENDELLGAYDISNQEQTWLEDISGLGISNDEDWYQIYISEGYENLVVDLRFEDDAGDLDLAVYDANGNYLIEEYSTTDNELIDTILPSSGTYYLQVNGYLEYTGNTYDLWWDDLPV